MSFKVLPAAQTKEPAVLIEGSHLIVHLVRVPDSRILISPETDEDRRLESTGVELTIAHLKDRNLFTVNFDRPAEHDEALACAKALVEALEQLPAKGVPVAGRKGVA